MLFCVRPRNSPSSAPNHCVDMLVNLARTVHFLPAARLESNIDRHGAEGQMPAVVRTYYSHRSLHMADCAGVVRRVEILQRTDDIEYPPVKVPVAVHSFVEVARHQIVLFALMIVPTGFGDRHSRVGCSLDHLRHSVCVHAVQSNNQRQWRQQKQRQEPKIVEKIRTPGELQRDARTAKRPLHCEPSEAHHVRVG